MSRFARLAFAISSLPPALPRMILADDERSAAPLWRSFCPFQRQDFEALFAAMGERPVTVRLLDPPLHESR